MQRLFEQKLAEWKSSIHRKPLIVRGARQVGKSYTIRKFGQDHFSGKLHVIDFERHPDWHDVFDHNFDPFRIIRELEILTQSKIIPGTDLLFFDEIQACPKAIMSLRYFYEEMPELHVISAGSLLEFALGQISFPVGRVQLAQMYPMNFYEFLVATGKEKLAEIIVSQPTRLSDPIHEMLLNNLKQYLFIGGMPECVKVWSDQNSLNDVFEAQSNLMHTFRQDFSKYTPHIDPECLRHTLDYLSKNIGNQIKYSRITDQYSGPTAKKGLELLQTARIISKVRSTSAVNLPLAGFASDKKFKVILLDLGLIHAQNGLRANVEYLQKDLLSMYQGSLAEQFAGQEFLSADSEGLYYWDREEKSSQAEVDFLITNGAEILPVEIKAGSSGRLRSMHQLLKEHADISIGYCLSTGNYGVDLNYRIAFLPLYYAWWLASQKDKIATIA